jgi:excisionase family DNA binding protein
MPAQSREPRTAPPLAVPPAEAARLLSLSLARLYRLMRDGELQSYLDGRTRRITTASIHDYIARRLSAARTGGWQQWAHHPHQREQCESTSVE